MTLHRNLEKSLSPFNERLKTTFMRRWFEICNDLAWCVNGILGCFVLIGNLACYSMILTSILFFYDVILISIKSSLELAKIDNLKSDYIEIPKITQYLNNVHELESKRFCINLTSTITIFLGFTLSLPMFSNFMILPILGSSLFFFGTLEHF